MFFELNETITVGSGGVRSRI